MSCADLCRQSVPCHTHISILHLNPCQHTPVVQNRLIKAGCVPFNYTISGLSSVLDVWNQDRICESIPFHVLGWIWPNMKTMVYRTWQLPPGSSTVSQKLSKKKLAKMHPSEHGHKIPLSLRKIVTKMKNGHIETFPHNRQELLLLTESPLFSPGLIRSWESRWQYKNYQLHVIHIFLISYQKLTISELPTVLIRSQIEMAAICLSYF